MHRLLLLFFLNCSISVFAQNADSLAAHRLRYKTDLANDIGADTSKVEFFPFKKDFVIKGTVTLLKDQPIFKLITSSGKTKDAQKMLKVVFTYKGKTHVLFGYQLTALKESAEYADHFFIPFKDQTNNSLTYAAGRYLDFKSGDVKNGKLTIDFNKAYNPYCAFTDGYNCPIPPKENTLKIAVTAGEKKYQGERAD